MQVIVAPAAAADLARIRAYIGMFNPMAARRMAMRIIAAADSLARFPERGRPIGGGRRELTIVPPYVLVYRAATDRVISLRVWHGARQRE